MGLGVYGRVHLPEPRVHQSPPKQTLLLQTWAKWPSFRIKGFLKVLRGRDSQQGPIQYETPSREFCGYLSHFVPAVVFMNHRSQLLV